MANLLFKVKNFGKKYSLHITGAACIINFLIGTGKLVMGVISLSIFTGVNALYTYGMVLAKVFSLRGMKQDTKKQYTYYRLAAVMLIITSILFAIYSIRLFWYPEAAKYDMNVGIAIAAFTFTEIGLNIRGVIVERKNKELLHHSLKMLSLASSLISLVLTQTAILSFTHEGITDYDPSVPNAAIGLFMGSISALLGVFMLFRVHRIQTLNSK